MIVKLKSNFDLGSDEIGLEGSEVTLRRLLAELPRRTGTKNDFLDSRTNDLNHFFMVSVNGKEQDYLPKGLDTILKDGDEVNISIASFAGG